MNLITDRTYEDVNYAQTLHAKGLSGMTAEELTEWMNGLKGWYDYRDLNRVGEAMNYLCDRLKTVVGDINISPRTDWILSEMPTHNSVSEYLNNIRTLRNSIIVTKDMPEVPSGVALNYEEANDIEKILELLDILIDKIEQAYLYSGEIYAGEV